MEKTLPRGGTLDLLNENMEHITLRQLCESVFDGDVAATALALGRDQDQIEHLLTSEDEIDEDLDMKIQGIADERMGERSASA